MTGPIHTPSGPLVGRLGTTLSEQPRLSSLQQMDRIRGTTGRLSEDQEAQFRHASDALLRMGSQEHRSSILAHPDFQGGEAAYDQRLQQALGWVDAGHREGYFHAFRWLFVLTHHRLEDPALQGQAVSYIQRFNELANDYRGFFQNDGELSPLHQFRYLHHTARITRTMLARIEDSPAFSEAHPELVAQLRETLSRIYSDLLDDAQGIAVHQMGEGEISPLVTDIEMRRALLSHNFSEARSLAWRLCRYYQNHPLSETEPEASSELWTWRAGHEILEDGLAVHLANDMHQTSDAERSQMILNSMAAELVVQAAASVDGINRDDETEIQSRYQAYSTVATAMILAHPGMSIREITRRMASEDSLETLQQELAAVSETHPDVAERIAEVQESLGDTPLVNAARQAAARILRHAEGPGHTLLEAVFSRSENLAYNPVAQVREAIEAYPQIIADLELSYDHSDHEAAALELLRSGPQAATVLQGYARQVPREQAAGIRAIADALAQQPTPSDILNQFTGEMIEIYAAQLRSDSEATFAGVVNSLHLINSLEDYAEGIPVHQELRTHTADMLEELDSMGFGVERAFNRMTSGDSLWSLAAGALAAEFLPAFLLARAGTTARAGNLGRLVTGGALTWRARVLTGFVTGATMSLVGTSLHHRNRAQEGLTTTWGMWGEDLAVSTAMNTVVFGATMPLSARLARALTPEAQAGGQIGRLSLSRRLALRAGTAFMGGSIALGTSTGLRLTQTGQLSTSWDEVAENYLSIILFETMAGAMRWGRHRVGLAAELSGRPRYRGLPRGERIAALDQVVLAGEEPANTQRYVPDSTPLAERAATLEARQSALAPGERLPLGDRLRLGLYRNGGVQGLHEFLRFGSRARTRLGDAFRSRLAGVFNDFFTVIGTQRVQQIDGLVDAMIAEEPGLRNYRETLRYQLALREAAAPGSLETILEQQDGRYTLLEGYRPQLNFESGTPRLEFVDATTPRGPEVLETITDRDLAFLRHQLADMVPGQEHQLTLMQEINGEPGQVLRLHLHPVTRQILSIGAPPEIPEGTRFEPLVYDAVVDPVGRRLLLPPTEAGGEPSALPYGEIMTYYQGELARHARLNPFGSNQPSQGTMRRISPFSWNQQILARIQQMMQSPTGFRLPATQDASDGVPGQIRQAITSGELPSTVWVIVETGPSPQSRLIIMDPRTPPEQFPRLPDHHIRLEGSLNRFTQTITLPPTVEMAGRGEVVLNFETLNVSTRSTSTAEGSGTRAAATR